MTWGLVGASTIASQWMINAFRSVQADSVTWLVSGNLDRAKAYAADHAIPNVTADLDEMLADPRVTRVYISSTNEKHYPQAMAAIAAGKHVFCEKPLAMSVADAAEMVRAARDRGVVFATNHHLRNAGAHLEVKRLIDAGRIGAIQSIRIFHAVSLPEALRGWRIDNAAAGGGVILDIVVHDADTVRFHTGEDPVAAVAIADATGLGQGVEDSVMTAWEMPSGAMVQVHASFNHQFTETGIEIYGSKGAIKGRGIMTQRPVGSLELIDADGRHDIAFSDHNLYARAAALFDGAVKGTGDPAASGQDGVKSLAIALAVIEAAKTGRKVTIDYGGAD